MVTSSLLPRETLPSHILPLLWQHGELLLRSLEFSQQFNVILLSGVYPTIREFGVPSVMLEATNMIISY